MKRFSQFPAFRQLDKMDCGPTCLKIICSYYGAHYSLEFLRNISGTNKKGVFVGGLLEALDYLKMDAIPISINFEKLKNDVPFPCIIHWRHDHYMVVYKISKSHVYTSNPKVGLIKYSHAEFKKGWIYKSKTNKGTTILVRPRADFNLKGQMGNNKTHWVFISNYFTRYRKLVYQLFFGLLVGLAIELTLPFLTQSVVDYGINFNDFSFVKLILLAQLFIYLTQAAIEIIRSWILLHITARVNIQIISDYILMLLGMPIAFFETKTTGDFIQRMEDHNRVSNFLSANSLLSLSGILEIFFFGLVLMYFDFKIFVVFLTGTSIFYIWHSFFLKRREQLDYLGFEKQAENKSKIIQLIEGVSEIKFNASQRRRRSEWYRTQTELFQLSIQSLRLRQLQLNGGRIINEVKNIIVIFIAASAVISGSITLGTMLAVMFIISALNGPLFELVDFSLNFQDAKLSFERISEIHALKPEYNNPDIIYIPNKVGISFKNINFSYPGAGPRVILDDINCSFPIKKTTAIVGSSGSGKTTLIKLLLKVYDPTSGDIFVDDLNLNSIGSNLWRKQCGVVLQDGYLFNDTIKRNITESDSNNPIDITRYNEAIKVSNLNSIINGLPLGDETLIHNSGSNISGGELQRILIARAVYKNPSFLFFDEATSSLDSKNESEIIKNLNNFYKDRTVIIVAHRLSTVRNADQIIVMEQGSIVETGTHEDLINKKGFYYQLVMKQL